METMVYCFNCGNAYVKSSIEGKFPYKPVGCPICGNQESREIQRLG